MDNYRDDGFDRSSQCFQEIIKLIALNSRHCNTFCWRRELNHTENGKVLHEKALKMKGHLLALRLRPTPLTYTDCFGVETTLCTDSPVLQARVSVGSMSLHTQSQHSHCHLHQEGAHMPTTLPHR